MASGRKFQALLEAAAELFEKEENVDSGGTECGDRAGISMTETPAVGLYEEVQSTPWHEISTSFRDVVTSTPKIPLSRPGHIALDLSQTLTDIEDEPLNLSVKNSSNDPIDLVLLKSEPTTSFRAKVGGPLNLIVVRRPDPVQIETEHVNQNSSRPSIPAGSEGIPTPELQPSMTKENDGDPDYSSGAFRGPPKDSEGIHKETVVNEPESDRQVERDVPCVVSWPNPVQIETEHVNQNSSRRSIPAGSEGIPTPELLPSMAKANNGDPDHSSGAFRGPPEDSEGIHKESVINEPESDRQVERDVPCVVSWPDPVQIETEHVNQNSSRPSIPAGSEGIPTPELLPSMAKANNGDPDHSSGAFRGPPEDSEGIHKETVINEPESDRQVERVVQCMLDDVDVAPSTSKDIKVVPTNEERRNTCTDGHMSIEDENEACNSGDDRDDDESLIDEITIGDASLLNDISVFEYFRPYHNISLIEPEVDEEIEAEPANRKRKSSEMEMAVARSPLRENVDNESNGNSDNVGSIGEPTTNPTGCEELEKENVVQRKTRSANREVVKNRVLKARGLKYRRGDGSTVPARRIKQSCNCPKLQCSEKYTDELRVRLLENFLKLTVSAQNQFLSNHISVGHVGKHTVDRSRREITRCYFLPGVGGRVKVCKKMFLSTFDISAKKIRVLATKFIKGTGIAFDDQRCHNRNRNLISDEDKKRVEEHILSFPSCTSHYTREKSSRLYLSSDLNIKIMYELYQQQYHNDQTNPVHYNSYRLIFNRFNLTFRKPRADTCNTCDKLLTESKVVTGTDREDVQQRLIRHQEQAKAMYDEKQKDISASKSNHSIKVASFDLQKCLPTPFLMCGQAFYKRQLYTLNLTVFETFKGKNEAHCYLWNEAIARRGAQEIGSCILYHIQRTLEEHDPSDALKLIFYSDRCSGQNLNFVMCTTFLYIIDLCHREGREVTICHKLMTSGHSHMEVDSVHAAIERAKKKTNIDIETPRDWAVFISQIRRKIPINVVELNQLNFLALKDLNLHFQRPKFNTDGQLIKLRDILWFEYRTAQPGHVFYKQNVEDNYSCFNALKAKEAIPDPLKLVPITTEPIPLSQEKLEDLRSLLPFITNKAYYEVMLKNLLPPKRGRKKANKIEDHFENDLDIFEEEQE